MKPGVKRSIKPAQLQKLAALRRDGMSFADLAAHAGFSERWLRDLLAPYGVVRRRNPILVLLAQTRATPRLDLARRVLDMGEWLKLPAPLRTIHALEAIRGVSFGRNHARWFRETEALGVDLRRVDRPDGEAAFFEIANPARVSALFSETALKEAERVRLAFQRRRAKRIDLTEEEIATRAAAVRAARPGALRADDHEKADQLTKALEIEDSPPEYQGGMI